MNTTLQALLNQAERLVRAEAYKEAIALCHAILRRYPRCARCYRILGEAYLGQGEHEEAANLFRRVLGVDPEDPIAYAGLGLIFEERGLLQEAIWQMERAFELAPGRDELRHELGRLYAQRGSPAEVQLTRGALARLYARGGLWDKAIGELRDLLAREPYRLDLQVALARSLWRAKRRPEAAALAQAILEQAPNCLVARLILGTFWCQEGRDGEGRTVLQVAQELDPENREAARLLGVESPLPLRVARVEADATGAAEAQEEEEEAEAWASEKAVPEPAAEDAPTRELSSTWPALAIEPPAEEAAPVPLEAGPQAAEDQVEPAPADEGAAVIGQAPAAGPLPEEAGVTEAPEIAGPALLSPISLLRRRLDESPDDHEARLALARALVEGGQLGEALPLYDALASPITGYLEAALNDLVALVQAGAEDRALRELLGDVYARAGRFQEAMEMYRWLLAHQG